MHDVKTGNIYGTGVILATSKKRMDTKLAAATQNPQGTPK